MVEKGDSPIENLSQDDQEVKDAISEILEVDENKNTWDFHDLTIDSGLFGELADTEIIEKTGDSYFVAEKKRAYGLIDDDLENSKREQKTEHGSHSVPTQKLISQINIFNLIRAKLGNTYILALLLLLLAGAHLRFTGLGNNSFWIDEIFHAWAAENFIDGQGFTLPGGSAYNRAWLTVSLPIAVSFTLFGPSELAARSPTALIGILSIPVYYYFGQVIINKNAGILLAGVSTFDTWILTWNQQARMYSHLQLLFVLSILLLYLWDRSGLKFKSHYIYLLVPVGLLGYNSHISYMEFGPIMLLYFIIGYMKNLYLSQVAGVEINQIKFRNQKVLIVCLLTAATIFLYVRGIPGVLLGQTPNWYTAQRSASYYWEFLGNQRPILYYMFFPSAVYLAFKKDAERLLVISFSLPFLLQGYISNLLVERYIFLIYPSFLLISLSLISEVIESIPLGDWINDSYTFPEIIGNFGIASLIRVIVCLLLTMSLVSPTASAGFVKNEPHGHININAEHREATQYIKDNIKNNEVVISTNPLITEWYYEGVGYGLASNREHIVPLENETEFSTLINERSAWVIADRRYGYLPPDMKRLIERRSTLRIVKYDGITIYYINE